MNYVIRSLIEDCEKQPGATSAAIEEILAIYPSFSDDHIALLNEVDGFEGPVGNSYVQIWSAQQVIELNREYQTDEFATGFVLVGTNLGGEGFAIDLRTDWLGYVTIPLCPISVEDARPIGTSLEEFLKKLHKGLFD